MLDRTIPPSHSTSFSVDFQHVKQHRLDNDVPLYTLVAGTQPVIKIEAVFPTGGTYYEKKSAVSLLALKMLKEGTISFSSSELSAHFAKYGAFVDVNPSFDEPSISLYCLAKHLNVLLPYFSEMILAPTFPATDLKRLKQIEIQQLRVQNEKTSIVASKKFRNLLYGDEYPYGKIIEAQDIEEITPDDLKAFHEHSLSSFELLLSGQPDPDAMAMIHSTFGHAVVTPGWEPDLVKIKSSAHTHIVEPKNNALQSSIRMGRLIINKDHNDYIPLLITSHVLGGYFGSRLMKNIREEKGYTYGIYSSVIALKNSAYFVIASDVIKEYATETVAEIKSELQDLCNSPIDDHELDTVKNHMLGHFQSQINSAFSLIEKFKDIHTHGLDYSYYQKYLHALESIDSQTIQAMANQYFKPDIMRTVTIG